MPDPTTLDQVDARVAAATPGPWRPQWSRGATLDTWVVMHGYEPVVIGCRPEDVDLIAHAPTDLASMSAELRELRAVVEEVEAERGRREDTPVGVRDQGRDLLVEAIDSYIDETGEFRPYDLADRLLRRFNVGGWWFVWGSDVERMISQHRTGGG